MSLLEIFTQSVDTVFKNSIEQHPTVAKYTSHLSTDTYRGNVFLKPDWQLYEFHITLEDYKTSLTYSAGRQQSINGLLHNEITNITKLRQVEPKVHSNSLPLFELPNIDWQRVSERENVEFRQAFRFFIDSSAHHRSAKHEEIRFFYCMLSFYPGARLIAVNSEHFKPANKWLYFLEGQSNDGKTQYYTLNGLSAPLHDFNLKCPIEISIDTVLDYLCFFCFFIQSEDGSFYVLQQANDAAIPDIMWSHTFIHKNKPFDLLSFYKRPKVIKANDKSYLCEVTIYCGNTLNIFEMEVTTQGLCTIKRTIDLRNSLPFKLNIQLS